MDQVYRNPREEHAATQVAGGRRDCVGCCGVECDVAFGRSWDHKATIIPDAHILG